MEPAIDPFQKLVHLVDRYRSDVHGLRPPAQEDALAQAVQHLGVSLPGSLRAFLLRWNGAKLFRGVLRIRSTAELASVSTDIPRVILFADGPGKTDLWAFTETPDGGHVFGEWLHDRLLPMHRLFQHWLQAMLERMEQEPRDEQSLLALRRSCDPNSPYLLLMEAEALMSRGEAGRAQALLRLASVEAPQLPTPWQRLGDVLVATDRPQARWCYIKAFRTVRLPLPYPGAPSGDPDLVGSLQTLFEPTDPAWERELEDLLDQRVSDVATESEAAFVEAAAIALGRVLLARNERELAWTRLKSILSRLDSFRWGRPFIELSLFLARLATEIGHHDRAEKHLDRLMDHPDRNTRGRARMALGRLVLARQEPWAEEILGEALELLTDKSWRLEAMLLLAERHLLMDRLQDAALVLERAQQLASTLADPALLGMTALLSGDLHRHAGDPESAGDSYREAERRALDCSYMELRYRLALRAGDLALDAERIDDAHRDYTEAVKGFRSLRLVLREGWALLRLGRLGDQQAIVEARSLFKKADMAAGVAAADAIAGDPAKSMAWHLERATEHARLRADAQRSSPPLRRADAERPERRLGAHQAAIAACGHRVVDELGQILKNSTRVLAGSSASSGGTTLDRYLAALDLLIHHRSYDAAALLLDHLLNDYISGTPGRALVSALTRSPNMALVSGIMETLDRDLPPSSVARAIEVLGWRREEAAIPRLMQLSGESAHPRIRKAALMALGRVGATEAVPAALQALEVSGLAATAAMALLLLGDRRGVDFHAQTLAGGDITPDNEAGDIVGRYGDPSFLLILLRAAAGDGAVARGAVEGLGYLGDPLAVGKLLSLDYGRDSRKIHVLNGALELLTGHEEPADSPALVKRWQRYWEKESARFVEGHRFRHGRLMDPGLLIEKLNDDELGLRRRAYDELVISTGVNLPFDADGAWRLQVAHRKQWLAWWKAHKEEFPTGRWMFHGQITA